MAVRNEYVDLNLNGQALTAGNARVTSVNVPNTRQTVLRGSVDSNGFPNALSIGSGLAVTLTATGTPFELAFAAGIANGCIDFITGFTTNQSFSALTASTTNFLYVERNVTTGALTVGFSVLQPVYSTVAPSSPATDQHWFDLSTFTMKRWSGSAFVVLQRVFIGEAVTGASTVTSVITYAYQRIYQSIWVAVVADTSYSFNHNLGIPIASASAQIAVFASTTANDNTAMLATPFVQAATLNYGYTMLYSSNAIVRNALTINTKALSVLSTANAYQATGFYKVTVKGGW